MYGYTHLLVSRGLYDPRSPERAAFSPYRFEPGEPDDLEDRAAAKGGTIALLVVYALVVALVVAASWIGGTDAPASTEQARRATDCVHATGVWTGCLPTK